MEVSRSDLLNAMSVLVKEGEWICDTYFTIIICHFVINMLGVVAGTDPKLQEAMNRDFNLGYTFWYDLALMGVINLPRLLGFFIYVFIGDRDVEDGQQIYKSLGVLWKHISEMNRNRPAEKNERVIAAVAREARVSRTASRTRRRRSRSRSRLRSQPQLTDEKKGGKKTRKTRKKRQKNLKKRTKKRARRRGSGRR
jgi:hypothetical protein